MISCGDDGAGPVDDGGGGNNTLPDPVPTAEGVPDGDPVTATIGAGGGSLASADGQLTLHVPPGALAADTDITIQPLTNTAWGGVGAGYELTPDGLTFAAPVDLEFEVGPEALAGTSAEALNVAVQDDAGYWFVLKNREYNDALGTLTCTTTHLSCYSMIEGYQIHPASASTGPNGVVNLEVVQCFYRTVANDPQYSLQLIMCSDDDDNLVGFVHPTNWSVNGVTGGNSTVGRVAATTSESARYTAPAGVPQANPVAVSCKMGSTITLVANITIGDSWYGTATAQWGNGEKAVATVVWTSAGTFQNIETLTASGLVEYTPDTDYGDVCWFVSLTPDTVAVDPAYAQLIIDHSTNPPKFYGSGSTFLLAEVCYTCEGWDQPECQDNTLYSLDWFSVQETDGFTVSNNGQTMSQSWFDITAGTGYTVDFTRGVPPVPLRR
jgi:hypothetical protein